MPVIAVGAAIAAVATAGAGIAAVGLTIATGLEVVAAVGATLGAIGQITHNKVLSEVGMGLGVVGGIGSLAAGAGLFGDAAAAGSPQSLFGPTAAASTQESTASAATNALDTGAVSATSGGAAANPDLIDALASGTDVSAPGAAGQLANAPDIASAAAPEVTAAASPDVVPKDIGLFATNSAPDSGAAASATAEASTPPATAGGTSPSGATLDPNAAATNPPTAFTPTPQGATANTIQDPNATDFGQVAKPGYDTTGAVLPEPPTTPDSGGFLGKLMSIVDQHPSLAIGAVQAGGSLLSGLTSTLTPAQVAALNAQAAANQAAANLAQQQTSNLAMPKAVASSVPVTGSPQPIVPGLINAAPRTNVTGVPA